MSIEAKREYRFEYLRSEDWKTLRNAILHRFNHQCFICKLADSKNDVHHVKYAKDRERQSVKDLVVLCRKCHQQVHEKLEQDGYEYGWKSFMMIVNEILGSSGIRRCIKKPKMLKISKVKPGYMFFADGI